MASAKIRKIEKQQVAQLVPKPIEIVEYQRQILECPHCRKLANSEWSPKIIPGQDLGVRLQGLLG
jgi:transposase